MSLRHRSQAHRSHAARTNVGQSVRATAKEFARSGLQKKRVRRVPRHQHEQFAERVRMMKYAIGMLLALGIAAQSGVHERDALVRFDAGIGVIPASAGAGPANADGTLPNVKSNVVRGVPPGAGPWRIGDLRAAVSADGHITVKGRGLLLASGNSIGQNASQSVFATLICEAAAPFVERSTSLAGVPLEANGDFRIDDVLNPAPAACASPVLLIRNLAGQWFAAGIVALGDN